MKVNIGPTEGREGLELRVAVGASRSPMTHLKRVGGSQRRRCDSVAGRLALHLDSRC